MTGAPSRTKSKMHDPELTQSASSAVGATAPALPPEPPTKTPPPPASTDPRPLPGELLSELVLWLLVVNAFNLLPIVPLDGGRLLDILLFARRPVLAVSFRVFAVLALVGLAYFSQSVILLIITLLIAFTVPLS